MDGASVRQYFAKALSDAGYVDGQNVAIEFRSSDGQTGRLQSVAEKLVAERVAVIVASQFVAGFAAREAV
jgi:putative ABC transport system substrate-binding protein